VSTPPAQAQIRHREIEPEQLKHAANKPLGLSQGEIKDEPSISTSSIARFE
jgi:hypothetical protein